MRGTGGPWEVVVGQQVDEGGKTFYLIRNLDGVEVARCYFDPKDNEARNAALADAERIAAAPRLEDALEWDLPALKDCDKCRRHGGGLCVGHSALAAARGESP